jgi:chemotaxis protein methyltransferase WspC
VLSRLLTPRGMLFVGPAESGVVLEHDFRSAKLPLAFAFRKAEAMPAKTVSAETWPLRAVPFLVRPAAAAASASSAAPAPGTRPAPPAARASTPPSPRVSSPSPASPAASSSASSPARKGDGPAELDEARELADQGRFDEAADRCDAHLRQHGPSADACFLLGLVRDARGRAPDAEAWYRKAIYLDQHHEHALLHLALLLERQDRVAEARVLRQRLRRVVAILKAAGPRGTPDRT